MRRIENLSPEHTASAWLSGDRRRHGFARRRLVSPLVGSGHTQDRYFISGTSTFSVPLFDGEGRDPSRLGVTSI